MGLSPWAGTSGWGGGAAAWQPATSAAPPAAATSRTFRRDSRFTIGPPSIRELHGRTSTRVGACAERSCVEKPAIEASRPVSRWRRRRCVATFRSARSRVDSRPVLGQRRSRGSDPPFAERRRPFPQSDGDRARRQANPDRGSRRQSDRASRGSQGRVRGEHLPPASLGAATSPPCRRNRLRTGNGARKSSGRHKGTARRPALCTRRTTCYSHIRSDSAFP